MRLYDAKGSFHGGRIEMWKNEYESMMTFLETKRETHPREVKRLLDALKRSGIADLDKGKVCFMLTWEEFATFMIASDIFKTPRSGHDYWETFTESCRLGKIY